MEGHFIGFHSSTDTILEGTKTSELRVTECILEPKLAYF
jgi:hypothetical protein